MNRIFLIFLSIVFPITLAAEIPFPFQTTEKSRYQFSFPEVGQGLVVEGSLEREGSMMNFSWGQGEKKANFSLLLPREARHAYLRFALTFSGRPSVQHDYYLKPNPSFYVSEARQRGWFYQFVDRYVFQEQNRILSHYHLFSPASRHVFQIRLDVQPEGVAIWLDTRLIDFLPGVPGKDSAFMELSPGCSVISVRKEKTLLQELFLSLPLGHYRRPGTLELKDITLNGETTLATVPVKVASWVEHIDVGVSRWLEEAIDPADFCDNYTTRSAFDGNPESIIFRIPRRFYRRAHLVCLVEPSSNKVPAIALRLTRFGNHYGDSGGRGDAFADKVVILPDGEKPRNENIQKVGEATIILGKKTVKVPLWLVSVDLPTGEISDLLGEQFPKFGREGDFLDLEVTKELRPAVHFFAYQNCSVKPLGLPSSVHLLALTLETSPVEVRINTRHGDFVFAGEKKPVVFVHLKNCQEKPFSGHLVLKTHDFYQRQNTRKTTISLPATGGREFQQTVEMDLSQPTVGWFQAHLQVIDQAGWVVWEEPFSYALLPPDTRKTGLESPFGVWWFASSHGGNPSLEVVGPLLQKMGIRHVCPTNWRTITGEQLARYNLSYSMAPWYGAKREEIVKDFFARHNQVDWVMIFHETGISGRLSQMFYPELLGKPEPELTPQEEERFQKLWQQAEEAARLFREKPRGVKITFGNSSPPLMVQFMRRKFPREYIDAFGIEGVAGWKMPERQPELGNFQELWWLKELKKRHGYEDIPVSSGFEWICRCTQPGALSLRNQAAYYTRDALHALAYGMPRINIGLLDDVADSYYYTIYGASGFLRRNPLLYPKPSYVAMATLTQVLDQAKFQRVWNTGSLSLYAFQFQKGKETVLATWTLRGEREIQVKVTKPGSAVLVDSMGNVTQMKSNQGIFSLRVSDLPCYLVLPEPIAAVNGGKSLLDDSLPASAVVLDDFSSEDGWKLAEARDEEIENNVFDNPARQGKGTIRWVKDEEKGMALEVSLLPQPEIPPVCPRYLILKP
ncbi:MAG: hypothetical protein NC823_00145, partial [Candidatus Omnitrophica bacterium]|nr:hypothetical protein [Candidatus Omnitrophota bacterium]